jgi:hypothetical protein
VEGAGDIDLVEGAGTVTVDGHVYGGRQKQRQGDYALLATLNV